MSEDDENITIQHLIHSEEEKMNFEMINHTIYSEDQLYKILMACCLGDCHQKLAITILNLLLKIREQQKSLGLKPEPYMDYLDLILAYVYLRLNYQ